MSRHIYMFLFYFLFFWFVSCFVFFFFFFFSSRRRHTRSLCDWSSDVCSSDLSFSREHFGEHQTECEYVGAGIGFLALQLFRSHIGGSAEHSVGLRQRFEIGRASCRERV